MPFYLKEKNNLICSSFYLSVKSFTCCFVIVKSAAFNGRDVKRCLDFVNTFQTYSESDKEPTALLNDARGHLAHTLTFGLIWGLLPTHTRLLPQQIPL